VLLILFLPSFYFLIRKHYENNAAVVAVLLLTLAPVLAINTIRLTTEMLSMVCIFFSVFFLTIALRKTDKFYAVTCGFFTGLLTLSKQAGFVVLGFYGLLGIWFFWNNRQNFKILLWVLAAAVATYSPYLVWAIYHKIEVFGFVSAFLGLTEKPEWSATALKSFRQHDSGIVEFAHLFYRAIGFVLTALLLLPLFNFARVRFKDAPQNYVFFLSIYLAIVMIVWHITNDRHTIILLPLIAFLIGYSFIQIVTHKLMRPALIVLLLLICGYFSYHLPDYRQRYNAPKEFVDLVELIREDAAPDSRVLGLRKFDTIMYTQKRVIWPHPKLRDIPIDIVKKQSADKLFEVLKKYQIKYILIETPLIIKSNRFYARSYPLYLVRNCEQLERQGRLSFVAMTKSKQFILLRVV
jgi:4-amino-4-deoxy-L-arabinose transferase-like glycosyltransferase